MLLMIQQKDKQRILTGKSIDANIVCLFVVWSIALGFVAHRDLKMTYSERAPNVDIFCRKEQIPSPIYHEIRAGQTFRQKQTFFSSEYVG